MDALNSWVVVVLGLLALATVVLGFFVRKPAAGTFPNSSPEKLSPRYRRADFLTGAESTFAMSLRQAAGPTWHLMAKVRLADLLLPSDPADRSGFNKVSSKHVDFVLCEPESLHPVLIVELDDSSHERAHRRERDSFLDAALVSVGLPVVRFKVSLAYDPSVLRRKLTGATNKEAGRSGGLDEVVRPTGPVIPTTDELRKQIRQKIAEIR